MNYVVIMCKLVEEIEICSDSIVKMHNHVLHSGDERHQRDGSIVTVLERGCQSLAMMGVIRVTVNRQ